MATLQQIGDALKKADAAGDSASAAVLAKAYRQMQQQGAPAATPAAAAPVAQPAPPPAPEPDFGTKLMNATGATVNGIVNGIPVLGPLAQGATDIMGGGIAQLTGGNFNNYIARQQALREGYAQKAPVASVMGNLGGGMATFGGLSTIPAVADALGLTAGKGLTGVISQSAKALGSNQVITTADLMAHGEKPTDAFGDALKYSGAAALIPGASAAIRAGGKAVYEGAVRPIAAAFNQDNEAIGRVSRAVAQDRASAAVMPSEQVAAATQAGAPIYNADRFGSAIRGLARAATNISPEAENALKSGVQDRFYTQAGRATGFVRQLMNGATDDLGLQTAIKSAADKANAVNYRIAEASPAAQKVFTPELQQLLQSDAIQKAIGQVVSRGSNRAAVDGTVKINNPFRLSPNDGRYRVVQKADGSLVAPNLAFWDQIKRNLDSQISAAQPTATQAGDRTLFADLTALKQKLVSSLDTEVPAYKQARGVAANFFGASDAVEAGRKAVTSVRNTPEIAAAVAKMNGPEKDGMSVGYASELIDKINAAGDRTNVINSVFGSPQARERTELILGPQRARELEAYTKAEQSLDMLRQAISGNSSTVQQLVRAGIVRGAEAGGAGILGYGASGGNLSVGLTTAAAVALGRRGLRLIGKNVDDQVMKKVADMLISQNPADVQKAIQNAALSKKNMDALTAIMRGATAAARGGIMGAAASQAVN